MTPEERLAVIRDAFLEGRDRDAVEQLLDLMVNEASRAGYTPTPFALADGESAASLPLYSDDPIPPGAVAQVIAYPQRPFEARRLIVVDECAAFDIEQITIGVNIQAVITSGPLSAALFSLRRGMPITFDPIPPGMVVRVVVANRGERAAAFRGAFWGVVPR